MANKNSFLRTLFALYSTVVAICFAIICRKQTWSLTLTGLLEFFRIFGNSLLIGFGVLLILLFLYRLALWFEEKPVDPNKKFPLEEGFVYVRQILS
jgi:hypothetical protein